MPRALAKPHPLAIAADGLKDCRVQDPLAGFAGQFVPGGGFLRGQAAVLEDGRIHPGDFFQRGAGAAVVVGTPLAKIVTPLGHRDFGLGMGFQGRDNGCHVLGKGFVVAVPCKLLDTQEVVRPQLHGGDSFLLPIIEGTGGKPSIRVTPSLPGHRLG